MARGMRRGQRFIGFVLPMFSHSSAVLRHSAAFFAFLKKQINRPDGRSRALFLATNVGQARSMTELLRRAIGFISVSATYKLNNVS